MKMLVRRIAFVVLSLGLLSGTAYGAREVLASGSCTPGYECTDNIDCRLHTCPTTGKQMVCWLDGTGGGCCGCIRIE